MRYLPGFAALLLITTPPALRAQNGAAPNGAVSGTVVAAASGQPIGGAVVILESASDASVVASGGGTFLGRSLVSITDQDGAYRFAPLNAGVYRLLVRHLGFHPAVLQVDLSQAVPFRVSVGLVVNPIRLEAMDTRGTTTEPFARLRAPSEELRYGRLDAEQYRDERFLEGDAEVLTHSDVVEAVTLGETDLFRAVQRLPGVSTRDDFTASIWTRGAPWSQTRVYFDGLPLFNPVHAIGVFAGVNPDAIGTATFQPGVRSAEIGEGAAGVLDVTSRRPSRSGGLGELSVISARGAADWVAPNGHTALMLAARRSYIDFATRIAESLGADSGTYIPYAFFDLTGRFDAELGRGFGLEASGLLEQDHVDDAVPGLLRPTTGHWGNHAGRVSLLAPLGHWHTRTTVGVSNFTGDLGPKVDTAGIAASLPSHAPLSNSVQQTLLSTEITPHGNVAPPTWSAGIQLAVESQHFDGQYPRPYPVSGLDNSLVLDARLPVTSLWAEKRWGVGRHVAVETGLRLDAHRPLPNARGPGLAPRLAIRATPPGTRVTFTAAVQRSFQYTQALAPAGPSIGPDLYITDVWLLANDTIPVLRSDIATTGVETYVGAGWSASANLYLRRATGMAVPEPAPGGLASFRPIFVSSENRAHGLELSVRKLVGRLTMSASYTLSQSMQLSPSGISTIGGPYWYPSTADRRNVANVTAMMRMGTAWRVGGAFTAASGAPFSRFIIGQTACDSTTSQCSQPDTSALTIGLPNAERAPGYASLDALVDWTRSVGRFRIGAFLQLRNVLDRANAVTYFGTIKCSAASPPTLLPVPGGLCDRFDKGVPILPLVGVRVAF
jgi:hypothetical protein